MTTRRPGPHRLTLITSAHETPAPMPKKPPSDLPTPAAPPAASTARPGKRTARKGRSLPVVDAAVDPDALPLDDSALQAAWPEAVLALSDVEREQRVRRGLDSVLLDEVGDDGRRRTRGFVRAVLRVPLDHPKARVYGVFVEVERDAYLALRRAFADKVEARVEGRLATRLPFLDGAYGSRVWLVEDGSDRRARVVDVDDDALRHGPTIGPRARRPS
jgi:hypothetical protein